MAEHRVVHHHGIPRVEPPLHGDDDEEHRDLTAGHDGREEDIEKSENAFQHILHLPTFLVCRRAPAVGGVPDLDRECMAAIPDRRSAPPDQTMPTPGGLVSRGCADARQGRVAIDFDVR